MDEKEVRNIFEMKPQRSPQQRKSLEVGCKIMSEKLNAAGLDQRKVLEALPEIIRTEWTQSSFKEMYKLIMKTLHGYTSTTELNTKEISEVWDKLMEMLVEIHGPEIDQRFPSEEETENYLKSFKQ